MDTSRGSIAIPVPRLCLGTREPISRKNEYRMSNHAKDVIYRPQSSDWINRIERIKEKGRKYSENHINPAKKPEENSSSH